jgi:hypothetical protein
VAFHSTDSAPSAIHATFTILNSPFTISEREV